MFCALIFIYILQTNIDIRNNVVIKKNKKNGGGYELLFKDLETQPWSLDI